MVNIAKYEVPVEKLRWHCDPDLFDFDCTKDLAPLREFIGQDRAIGAIDFGLSMSHDGYNIYVAGLAGTGKTTAVKTHIDKLLKEKLASEQLKPPQDWCYLYNFTDSDRPQSISLPQGKGKVFSNQISGLLQKLKDDLAKAFSSEEYKTERKAIVEAAQDERQRLSRELSEEAQRQGLSIQVSPTAQAIIPVVNGKPIT
ncbi:Lon-like protease helical domain-containing protein, partial [Chloroflexota bacterium]